MENITFKQLRSLNEDQAREMLEAIRWPDGAVCPHCNSTEAYKLTPKAEGKKHVRFGVYKCKSCRKQFTVTVGTIFEGSRIKIADWLMALYLMCSSKKGISAHQLHRTLGVTYKTAWFMAHRIRLAMREAPLSDKLNGVVEVDETYVGGKMRGGKRGRGSENKTPVFALVQRGGQLRAHKVRNVTAGTLKNANRNNVDKNAVIMSDSFGAYSGLEEEFAGHEVVDHGAGEYVRGDAYTNTLEGCFALLKRGVTGTFNHVSEEHLDRYVDEFAFRYNNRKIEDGQRTVEAIRNAKGKRLYYKNITK